MPRLRNHTATASSRRGFTVVELIVSMAIVGLLMALLIPAVQQVRAASARTTCSSRLHQIGIAVESYVSTHQQLPFTQRTGVLFAILPYLEQTALHQRIEQLLATSPDPTAAFSAVVRLEFYQCPADTDATHPDTTSYHINEGLVEETGQQAAFISPRRLTWADVTDGLSQTAFCSERISAPNYPIGTPVDPKHGRWSASLVLSQYPRISDEELNQFVADCADLARHTVPTMVAGSGSYIGGHVYDHVERPNGRACNGYGHTVDLVQSDPAASNHPGGVNVLMADGAVRFTSSQIDLRVWRACGSRNGGESAASSF